MPLYAVKSGRVPGIYHNWNDASPQVECYPGAVHKKFKDTQKDQAYQFADIPLDDVPKTTVSNLKIKPLIIKKKQIVPGASVPTRHLSNIEKSYFNHNDLIIARNNDPKVLYVYTDGSAISNGFSDVTGGYGVFFSDASLSNISITLKTGKITNNVAELKAIIAAMKILKNLKCKWNVTLFYDSEYAAGVITGRTRAHTNLVIVDEGKQLLKELRHIDREPQFKHVYSHTKKCDLHSIGNDIADKLAGRIELI